MEIIVAIGEPSDRKSLADAVEGAGYKLASYIDKTAVVAATAKIGNGVIVYPYSYIDSNVTIENNVFVENTCNIGHDVRIGQNSVVGSQGVIGGFTDVGQNVYLGIGTILRDRIKVGDGVIIAMGSVVFNDIADNMTVMGNPARVTKGNDSRKVWN